MPMPPIISFISRCHVPIRFMRRLYPISGFRSLTRPGIWVAMPQLYLPDWQLPHRWQLRAISAAVAIYTQSASNATWNIYRGAEQAKSRRSPQESSLCGKYRRKFLAPGKPWPILISTTELLLRYCGWTPKRPEATCTIVFLPIL